MTLLLRVLARLVSLLWLLVLALLGLGVALYCLDGLIPLGSARPDRLLHLPSVHHDVARFLTQVEAPGATAGLALLCGLGAMLIGVLLLLGLLRGRRERSLILEDDERGRLSARPRAVADLARALAERAPGLAGVKRPRVRLSRRGTRGRLRLTVSRTRQADPDQLSSDLRHQLEPVTDAFHLRPKLRVQLGEPGERVQ